MLGNPAEMENLCLLRLEKEADDSTHVTVVKINKIM